ncbi:OLC1v1026442C1 [Oldenlandia corymbosa var. corymbosa]|uniref:OLC1v1026442C1 n=1 Tax=Oldenlandia corymbosa var. corymbosa TaxID=529605 RepID=A0AAV1C7D0_OLDCO|nr:OLC1v1026442C1 [Oldenlandia corymbosa var. corymbosa]
MEKTFHMIGGEDEASYSRNSSHQRLILRKVKPILEECIQQLLRDMKETDLPNNCIKVADLGCCSGPNTFLTIQLMIKSIDKTWSKISNTKLPTIQYFLNDLVSNDFNLVFKGLPRVYENLEKENGRKCGSFLIAAMPGSFHGRLFPDSSMHFLHSSYSMHWLSQVPRGLVMESGMPKNKGKSICAIKTSPSNVHQAYVDQFTRDFTTFLRMRSQEMVKYGQLLLTFLCQDSEEVEGSHYLLLMGMALSDMVTEGHIEEEKLDTFSLPIYEPSIQEVKQIIEDEGSFKILRFQNFKTCLDASFESRTLDDGIVRARYVATYLRAVFGPILESHFGESIMDGLFHRYQNKLVNLVEKRQGLLNNLVISLRREW